MRASSSTWSRRAAPVPLRAAEALSGLPPSSRLLFPSPEGALYALGNWRSREFDWAREAAGLAEDVTPYTLRHSGLSWAPHAGVPPNDVAKFGRTSVSMLERRYHHLLVSSAERRHVGAASGPRAGGASGPWNDENPALCAVFRECARQDSNLRPLPPQGSALSPELRARGSQV